MTYITGLCGAFTDYIAQISDAKLSALGFQKGVGTPVSDAAIKTIIQEHQGRFYPGGMVANSLVIASDLGSRTGFIGKLANDSCGRAFRSSLNTAKVAFNSKSHPDKDAVSATCIVFVTPDGERTMAFSNGVSQLIEDQDIADHVDILQETRIFYSGYAIRDANLSGIFAKAAAKTENAQIATTLQSIHREESEASISILSRADIIFGNEDEFPVFLQATGFKNLPDMAAAHPQKLLCCTLGKDGAQILQNQTEIFIPVYPAQVVDTTGAGDAFAGGFLHGVQKGYTLEQSGKIGSYCAAKIVGQIGARPAAKIDLSGLDSVTHNISLT